MKRWAWRLQRATETLGLPGVAGIALGLAAAAIWVAAVLPLAHDIEALDAGLAARRNQPAAERRYAPEDELKLFYDFFPTKAALPEQVRTLHRLAADAQLSIEQADYKLSRLSGSPLWRYQISFPLNTDYVTLRLFLAEVLKTLPNAALADIELQRDEAEAELLQERVELVLYFKDLP